MPPASATPGATTGARAPAPSLDVDPTADDLPTVTRGKQICTCRTCSRLTCRDEYGVKRRGCPQPPKTIKAHTRNDRLVASKIAIQEEVLGDAVLLATVGDAVSQMRLPVGSPTHIQTSADSPTPSSSGSSPPTDSTRVPDSIEADKRNRAVKARLEILSCLQSSLDHRLRALSSDPHLAFTLPPATPDDPPSPLDSSLRDTCNFSECLEWLESTQRYLATLPDLDDRDVDTRLARLLATVHGHLGRLKASLYSAWEVEKLRVGLYGLRMSSNGPVMYNPERHFKTRTLQPFIVAALIMTTILHAIHGVNRVDSHYVLTTIRVLLFGAFAFSCTTSSTRTPLTATQQAVLASVPKDVRTALKHLNIDPEIVRYACCPRCFKTFPPDETRPDDPYPHTCDGSETDKAVCGRPLVIRKDLQPLRRGDPSPRVVYVPMKPYPYRTFASWLGALFCRPELEPLLVSSWEHSKPTGSRYTDIFHSPEIQSFRGPDGQLFSVQKPGSVNLVFSLFVDWFNPYGNKQAGKSHSVGAIYLVCLNLPPELRYRPENVYLAGIIPGPKEPSLHQLNHLIRPLIDELEQFWTRGLFLKRTALRFTGLFLRAAVVPLVCDLPALRKVAGFAGHSSKHFCSFCRLRKHQISDLERPWPTRTAAQHRQIAEEWRGALTEAERNAIFEEHGIRWSELLRLPYWDPVRFPVVDAMHCLLLGDLRHHCRDVWGIDVKDKDRAGSKKAHPHTPKEQTQWLNRVVAALRKGSGSALSGIRKGYITAIAQMNGVAPKASMTKKDYIAVLLEWVKTHSIDDLVIPPVLQEDTVDFHLSEGPHDISKFRVLTQEVIDIIRSDIQRTVLPSWMQSPPRNFGSASHGKLKADQWRTVCTVSLVITLVRLWGVSSAAQRERLLLQNFIHLVSAVDLATRRAMDEERAKAFDDHMLKYLRGLQELFSHELVPNHHLSLHLTACLLMFGPVHGWWGFPFERYNGLLGSLKINNIPENIPLTFMHGFYAGAELRWLMASMSWPNDEVYGEMIDAFQSSFKDAARGTRGTDMASFVEGDADTTRPNATRPPKEVVLPRVHYDFLLTALPSSFSSFYGDVEDLRPKLSPYVQYVNKVLIRGLTYATGTHANRDSCILFRVPGDGSRQRMGKINAIFVHSRLDVDKHVRSTFLVISAFEELTSADVEHDPYRTFPSLRTRLCYNSSDIEYVVRTDDVLCHLATMPCATEQIAKECIVCRPLDRD